MLAAQTRMSGKFRRITPHGGPTRSEARRLRWDVSALLPALLLPRTGLLDEGVTNCRPVMQCRRIEVCAVRPREGADLGIEPHLIEDVEIAQRPKELATGHRFEVDDLPRAVPEHDGQRVWPDD